MEACSSVQLWSGILMSYSLERLYLIATALIEAASDNLRLPEVSFRLTSPGAAATIRTVSNQGSRFRLSGFLFYGLPFRRAPFLYLAISVGSRMGDLPAAAG